MERNIALHILFYLVGKRDNNFVSATMPFLEVCLEDNVKVFSEELTHMAHSG